MIYLETTSHEALYTVIPEILRRCLQANWNDAVIRYRDG